MKALPWVTKMSTYLPKDGLALDLACGGGRHSAFLSRHGLDVVATDIDVAAITELKVPNVEVVQADLEANPWPFKEEQFDLIVVTNYLWRPLFPHIEQSLKPNGTLIYSTFMLGNEEYGRPRSPDFLLKENELKEAFSRLDCLEFEQGYTESTNPAVRQSILCRKW